MDSQGVRLEVGGRGGGGGGGGGGSELWRQATETQDAPSSVSIAGPAPRSSPL